MGDPGRPRRPPAGAATAGASILLNWLHPAIPLDPPPGWLVSLAYGLPPLAAVFAWHLFLQRLGHRHHQDPQAARQDTVVSLTIERTPGRTARPPSRARSSALCSPTTPPSGP